MHQEVREDDREVLEYLIESHQHLEEALQEVNFWKKQSQRLDSSWTKTWVAFQERYNERLTEVNLLKEILEKLSQRPKELRYE